MNKEKEFVTPNPDSPTGIKEEEDLVTSPDSVFYKKISPQGLNDKEMEFCLYLLKKANKVQLSKLIREEHFGEVE